MSDDRRLPDAGPAIDAFRAALAGTQRVCHPRCGAVDDVGTEFSCSSECFMLSLEDMADGAAARAVRSDPNEEYRPLHEVLPPLGLA